MTEKAQKFVDSLDLEYSAAFIPQSQSRNAGEKDPTLNWRVVIAKGSAQIATDYMQGVGHLPNYSHQFARLAVYDDAVRDACETGVSPLIPHKNGYDACQAGLTFPRRTPVPPPALVDVLYCLVADAGALDYATFEDWASEYGYDTDSRKAEAAYRACLDIALQLRHILDLDAAREAFEDY